MSQFDLTGEQREIQEMAGASEERSRAAAEAVAKHEHRLSKLGTDVTLLKWMGGFNIALSVAMLGILPRSLA